MTETVLVCNALSKSYQDGDREIAVLRGVDLALNAGEKIAITGASGSGKSTLLNLLGALDLPSSGEVVLCNQNIALLSEKALCELRNKHLGFVYQFHHLLAEFDAKENVAMPLLVAGMKRRDAFEKAVDMLSRVGLDHRLKHRPGQLSGGERQRVAIARALVAEPACVLMDEPTGNLDPDSATQVLALIHELNNSRSAFVVVTHDHDIAKDLQAHYELCDGKLVRR